MRQVEVINCEGDMALHEDLRLKEDFDVYLAAFSFLRPEPSEGPEQGVTEDRVVDEAAEVLQAGLDAAGIRYTEAWSGDDGFLYLYTAVCGGSDITAALAKATALTQGIATHEIHDASWEDRPFNDQTTVHEQFLKAAVSVLQSGTAAGSVADIDAGGPNAVVWTPTRDDSLLLKRDFLEAAREAENNLRNAMTRLAREKGYDPQHVACNFYEVITAWSAEFCIRYGVEQRKAQRAKKVTGRGF